MRLGLSSFLAGVVAAGLAAAEPVVALKFEEKPPDQTLISKPSWLRGVHLVSTERATGPRLRAVLPPDWRGGRICVRATTRDGRYVATAGSELPPADTGGTPELAEFTLGFSPRYAEALRDATEADSGITVEKGGCDAAPGADGAEYLAALWNLGGDPAAAREIVLNLNVARADELLATIAPADKDGKPAGPLSAVTCVKLAAEDALAFNFVCRTSEYEAAEGRVVFDYQRVSRGRVSEPRSAVIRLAAP